MRRSGPPKRSTDMKRTGRIRLRPRRTGIVKGRYRATREEWADLHALARLLYKRCQVCGRDECGPLTLHHLVGRDMLGDDVIENLALLGGTGTTGCHGKVQELDRQACENLRSNMTDEQIRYVLNKTGPLTLARYFPERKKEAQ